MLCIKEEAARCLLCADGACDKACKSGYKPAEMIRSVYFENSESAGMFIDDSVCVNCQGDCESACIHYDRPIRIQEMVKLLPECKKPGSEGSIHRFFGSSFRKSVYAFFINSCRQL